MQLMFVAYQPFNTWPNMTLNFWLHYETIYQYPHTTCTTTFQLIMMNNSQAIDMFNMIYFFVLERFYDHVNQYSVKRTMVILTINI